MIRAINRTLFVLILVALYACNNQPDSVKEEQPVKAELKLKDSAERLLRQCEGLDSLSYLAFYGDNSPYKLLYFKMGHLFSGRSKNAVAIYSVNDTTLAFETYQAENASWVKTNDAGLLSIDGFSPAYFSAVYEDFNFDGITDLYINIYMTMRVADSFGFIFTFHPVDNTLRVHPETIKIANISIDKKERALVSTIYSNPNNTNENYKTEFRYQWLNDGLKLKSEKKIKL